MQKHSRHDNTDDHASESADMIEETGTSEQRAIGKIALFFLEAVKIAIVAGLTIVLVRYFLFKPFYVRGESMEPTFYEKEYLIVDELTYRFRQPVRGEVVVFRSPTQQKEFYLKRIIGLPGERIKIEHGKVVIFNQDNPQGFLIEESYLEDTTAGATSIALGDDQYFVLGDNRDASYDSRRFGPIDETAIVGRAIFRGWPIPRMAVFGAPEYVAE